MLLGQMIPGDGILPPSRRIHADPAGVNLLELLVMGARKLPAILRGDHAAAYAPLRQGIPRIKIVLGPTFTIRPIGSPELGAMARNRIS